jgi:protein SCO1/2
MSRMVALAASLALLWSCRAPVPPEHSYQLSGQILAIELPQSRVLIKHGDIPGFMPAMTMTYTVREPALLAGRKVGELVTATLVVTDTSSWLSALTRTGEAPLPADAPVRVPVAAGVRVLAPGDPVPSTPLTDQDDRAWSIDLWRGSAVAITFIYTRCPLPDFCPLMDLRFAEVQQRAAADPALAGRIHLLSVSFDPATDTPASLRAHAAARKAEPGVWRFATAAPDVVDRFAATFGVNVIREADGTITHNLRTAVIDPMGRVSAVLDGNQWTVDDLVGALGRALGPVTR